MLNFQTFLRYFDFIKENFQFDNSKIYIEMLYDALRDKVNDKMFIDACKSIIASTSKEDWNKAYGFNGRPAVKDWVDVMVPKLEAKRRYYKCSSTGATLTEVYYDYPQYYLDFLNVKKELEQQKNLVKIENLTTNN